MGLLARDDEYPAWARFYDSVSTVVFDLVVIGFGIAYIVMGNTTGQIVGICLVVAPLAAAVHWFRRRIRRSAGS